MNYESYRDASATDCRLLTVVPFPLLRGACLALAVIVVLGVLAPRAVAQTEWNRKVIAMAVMDGASGPVVHVWGVVQVVSASVPRNLSTEVELQINGVRTNTSSLNILVDGGGAGCQAGPPCNGTCGTAHVEGADIALRCFKDCVGASCDCQCGLWISAELDPVVPISTGDEIAVILRPAPGALPEQDTADDARRIGYRGEEVYWNRAVDSVELVPVPSGDPGVFDILVHGTVGWNGAPGPNLVLDLEADLRINGTVLDVQSGVFEGQPPFGHPDDLAAYCGLSGCIAVCGYVNAIPGSCQSDGAADCGCGTQFDLVFPNVAVDPGDEIMVLLRPAPGGLPELPPLQGDDQGEPETPASAETGPLRDRAMLGRPTPNPLVGRGEVAIPFQLPTSSAVSIAIFDATGTRVQTIVDQELPAGVSSRVWDGHDQAGEPAPSGIYYVRMQAGVSRESTSLVLLR